MKKFIIAGTIALIAILSWYYLTHPLIAKVRINNRTIPVEVAITATDKEIGLGGRTSLAANHGMLFVYDHPEQYPFWMKNMQFPLDFVWINNKKVIDLTRNVPVPPNPASDRIPVYHPISVVNNILELNAGEIDKLGIKIGDQVDFLSN